MKKSRYLTTIERDNGDIIVHSAMSGAVLRVRKENIAEYGLFCEGKLREEDDPLVRSVLKQARDSLKEAMILVDDDVDELELLAYLCAKTRYEGAHAVGLCIAPTMKCNLACPYCFNARAERQSMTRRTMIDVVNFIKIGPLSRAGRHSVVRVTWTGGEPLCDLKTFEELAGMLYDRAAEHDCPVSAMLLSNGTLLTEDTARTLSRAPFCVDTVQVTLDGPKRIHDTLRVPRSGKPTFDCICENIRLARNCLNINIRVAAVPDFQGADFERLLDELSERKVLERASGGVSMFVARVCPCKDDRPSSELAMSAERFATLELECARIARKRGVGGFSLKVWEMPTPVTCGALSSGFYAIDSEGFLSKCIETLGKREEAFGHVSSGPRALGAVTGAHSEATKWQSYNPFNRIDRECAECIVLPLCGGGCPLQKMAGAPKECSVAKYNLKERLLFHYLGE